MVSTHSSRLLLAVCYTCAPSVLSGAPSDERVLAFVSLGGCRDPPPPPPTPRPSVQAQLLTYALQCGGILVMWVLLKGVLLPLKLPALLVCMPGIMQDSLTTVVRVDYDEVF